MKQIALSSLALVAVFATQAQGSYKCSASIGNITATGATKNAAVFAAAQLCQKKSILPSMCLFQLINCREIRDPAVASWGCQLSTGVSLMTVAGATEDDARNAVITQCENTYSIPNLCPNFSITCIDLAE